MGTIVAMPMLMSADMPDLVKLEEQLQSLSEVVLTASASSKEHVVSFELDDIPISVIIIPQPIPWAELEGPCKTSLFWKNATQEVRSHSAHMLVSATGNAEPHELAWYLTKAIEALLLTVDAIGVYWGSGTLVTHKEMFISMSSRSSEEYLPLYLWIDFRCQQEDEETFSLFTTGMQSLGVMEIEIQDAKHVPPVLIDKAFNLAHYLLDNGPVLKDGDTFGVGPNERMKIRHSASFVERGEKVYRLEL